MEWGVGRVIEGHDIENKLFEVTADVKEERRRREGG